MNKSCEYCYEDLNENNGVFLSQSSHVFYNICKDCLMYQKNNRVNGFVTLLRKEDCLATIKRMLNSGIPLCIDEGVDTFYLSDNTSISNSYFQGEMMDKIKEINKKLKGLLDTLNEEKISEQINQILDQFF